MVAIRILGILSVLIALALVILGMFIPGDELLPSRDLPTDLAVVFALMGAVAVLVWRQLDIIRKRLDEIARRLQGPVGPGRPDQD